MPPTLAAEMRPSQFKCLSIFSGHRRSATVLSGGGDFTLLPPRYVHRRRVSITRPALPLRRLEFAPRGYLNSMPATHFITFRDGRLTSLTAACCAASGLADAHRPAGYLVPAHYCL